MIDKQLNDELRSIYNPDGSELRSLQLKELEILMVVNNICRRNNIPYWLSSGTLLGAVRHGGVIPWDDDIDIEILYKDRGRFINACKKELPQHLCLQYHTSDNEYYLNILKIRDNTIDIGEKISLGDNCKYNVKYKAKGYFIDVFFEEPALPGLIKLSNALCGRLYKARYIKHYSRQTCHVIFLGIQVLNVVFRLISYIFADKRYLFHSYGSCFCSRRHVSHIMPLQEICFEGMKSFAPANIDGYLTEMFGEYKKLPKEIERKSNHSDLE